MFLLLVEQRASRQREVEAQEREALHDEERAEAWFEASALRRSNAGHRLDKAVMQQKISALSKSCEAHARDKVVLHKRVEASEKRCAAMQEKLAALRKERAVVQLSKKVGQKSSRSICEVCLNSVCRPNMTDPAGACTFKARALAKCTSV